MVRISRITIDEFDVPIIKFVVVSVTEGHFKMISGLPGKD
jgi:hypothetical protein